jgi:hypothetical protein
MAHFGSKLYEFHTALENKLEAAETLAYCASLFSFDSLEPAGEGFGMPDQPQRERKRFLLDTAADLFIGAEFHERALDVIRELTEFHTARQPDYDALAKLAEREGNCWKKVAQMERSVLNRFYGAHFYGARFSQFYRDSIYIYRRGSFFMNDQMMRELKEKFPEAKADPRPPSEEELADPQLFYIHIFNVRVRETAKFDPFAPSSTHMYLSCCNANEFFSEAPVRKRLAGNYGEFAEWHRHITIYTIGVALQGPIRRAKVEAISPLIEMTPIECAFADTNAKTIELLQKACMYWRCRRFGLKYNPQAVSGFSMLASGIVNAAVNGGTKVFQEVFLESDLKDDPAVKKFAPDLKMAFADQLKAVEFALKVHWFVISPEYLPLHTNVRESFAKMQDVMEPAIGKVNLSEPPSFGAIPSTAYSEFDEEEAEDE